MCTLVLAWQALADAPVAAAATRDEAHDRPSRPPAVDEVAGTSVLAPRDERAGGTWLGVNEHGVFVALANRWTGRDLTADRSRGLLVDDALTAGSADAAAELVAEAVADTAYDGFWLVAADAENAWLLGWDGGLDRRGLEPGVHVVVNVGADGAFDVPPGRRAAGERQARGAQRARERLRVRDGETAASWRERARAALADHDLGLCVHGDGYGTRSATLVTVGADGTVAMAHGEGPPCTAPVRAVEASI
ncbi:MAG: NRDE family protein [Halobacteriaceae archaeon]